ncbi:hypothetical protein EYR36_010254 [Pleurotus pulmonarius]|nr:hypothetical protein EYR36_010254 [Pleurotus pulmonarius]
MATWKPQFSDQPSVDDPKDSRAKRLERQQSRFRDRGGIFVPSNRNTLLDVLLARTMSVDSPRTAAASSNAARRRSQSSSPLRRPSHTPRETPSASRGRSSDVNAYNEAPVASPTRLAKAAKVARSERHGAKDDAKISKVSKGSSAKRRGKSRASETAQTTDAGADRLPPDASSTSEGESSSSKKAQPKAKAPPARSRARLSTIVESENESDAAVEPPPRKKSKGPPRRSRSLSPESELVEQKAVIAPPARKKPKVPLKRATSRVETDEAVEEPRRPSTSKSKGKGKKTAASKREILDDDGEEPDVPSKAKKLSRPVPSKKGSKKKQAAPSKAFPLPDPPVPLEPDPGVRSKSRGDEEDPPKKAPKSKKRQQEDADAAGDPQHPRKRPKSQPAEVNEVKLKKSTIVINDEVDPPKKPSKSKKRQQEAEEDTVEDPPPRKRRKSQTADDISAKPAKKSVAIKVEPKGKISSSKVLKENTADKNLPPKAANKPAKTKKPVSKRQKSRHLPKVVLERIQRSLNESHEVDDEPDPIDFLS